MKHTRREERETITKSYALETYRGFVTTLMTNTKFQTRTPN